MLSPVWRAHASAGKHLPSGMVRVSLTLCSKVTRPNSAQTHKATCTISLVFSVVLTLLPAKKVVLSVDSWVTKGLEHS